MEYWNDSLCDLVSHCMSNVTAISPELQNTSTESSIMPEIPLYIHVLFSILYVPLFILGVSGNMLVICVILRSKAMHSATNYLLLNLAVSDFLVILICLPTAFVDIFAKEVWYFGALMCHLVYFLENATAVSSVLSITAICVERFFAICKKRFFQHSMLIVVAGLWVASLSICVPFYTMTLHKDSTHLDGTPIKVCRLYVNSPLRRVYLSTFSVLFYVLPCIILVLLYYLIIKHVTRETMATNNEDTLTESRRKSLRQRRQAIHMLRMVTVLCFVCLLPFHGLRVLLLYVDTDSTFTLEGYMLYLNTSRVAFYLNSIVNPLIYNIFSSKFRAAFKHALGCSTRSNRGTFSRVSMTTV